MRRGTKPVRPVLPGGNGSATGAAIV